MNTPPPVRCFTCGKIIGNLFQRYHFHIRNEGMSERDAATAVGCIRYCCRANLITTPNGSGSGQPPLTFEPGDAIRFRSADPSAPQKIRNIQAI